MDLPSTSQRGSARCKVPDVPDVDVDVDVALPRRGGRAGAPFAGKRLGGNPKENPWFSENDLHFWWGFLGFLQPCKRLQGRNYV